MVSSIFSKFFVQVFGERPRLIHILNNHTRCQCGKCEVMPTATECVCCQEISATADKIGTSESSAIQCITDHEGFDAVCLNVWVLQTSYFTYRYHYGTRDVRDEPQHE